MLLRSCLGTSVFVVDRAAFFGGDWPHGYQPIAAPDEFLARELKTDLLRVASEEADYPVDIHIQPGYDHSYFFIASFIDEHLRFHARHL